MSDTLRTDARVFDADLVSASFARKLERDLARKEISLSRNNELMYAMSRENAKLREALKWAEPYVPKRADCETRRMIESLLPNV